MENEPNTSIGPSENMNVTIEPNIPLRRSTRTRKPVSCEIKSVKVLQI